MLHRFHSLASDDVLISQSVKAFVYLLNWHTAAVAEKRKSKMLSLTFLSNTWRRDMKENMWERLKFIGVRNLSMKSYEKSFFLLEVSIFHKVGESRTELTSKLIFQIWNLLISSHWLELVYTVEVRKMNSIIGRKLRRPNFEAKVGGNFHRIEPAGP